MQRTQDGWKSEQAIEEAWYQETLGKDQCKTLPSGVLGSRCEPYLKSNSSYKTITFRVLWDGEYPHLTSKSLMHMKVQSP